MNNKVADAVQVTVDKKLAPESGGRLRSHLIKGAAGSFVLQVGFAGFSFLNALILARVLGAKGYGAFVNAMAWVSLLTIPATFGLGILLVRDVAIYRSQSKWALLKGLLRFSDRVALVLSVTLALVAAGVAGWIFSSPAEVMMRHTVWIALLLLPLLALCNLRERTTRGLEHVVRAQLPRLLVRPGLLLAGIVVIYLLWREQLSAPVAMMVNVGASIVALGLGVFFLRRLLPEEAKSTRAVYTTRHWLKAAFPMLVYGGAQILIGQTDIVMLGTMRGSDEAGVYAVAFRLAFLLGYAMMAAEMIVAPIIARLYANGEKDRLQKIVTRMVRIAFLSVLPFAMVLIFAAAIILGIFGHDFVAAQTVLIILTVGRLLHIALGPGALLLSMTGHERTVAYILILTALGNVIANVVLIPLYGIEGAAIASVASLVLMRFVLSTYVVLRTGLSVTLIGVIKT